jgi:hypothetical protein
MQGNTVSVERVINAGADAIFALLADAGKHSSFDGSGTVDHATRTSQPLSLGAQFGMSMRGRPESSPCPSGGGAPSSCRTARRTRSSNSNRTAASRGRRRSARSV